MKNKFYILAVAVSIFLLACNKDLGKFVQVRIGTPSFTMLAQDACTDIILSQGPFNIDFEGYEDVLADLDFRVVNKKLIVSQRGNYWYSSKSTIYITVPDLSSIEISSSGDIYGDQRFVFNGDLDIYSKASGDLDISIDAADVFTYVRGSGDIRLRSDVDNHAIEHDGSGNIYAYYLESLRTKIYQSGSGDAELSASNNLLVRLRGSGDIYFVGNPFVDYSISGSGRLIDAN